MAAGAARTGRFASPLAWPKATKRLLMLEAQLIDDRPLTVPPDATPWDDVRRDRLRDLRRERL